MTRRSPERAPRRARSPQPTGSRIRVPTVEPRIEPESVTLKRARTRIGVLAIAVGIGLAAIGFRAANLCVMPAEKTVQYGSQQRWEQMTLLARRGAIFDRSGEPLVRSVDTPTIVLDPQVLREAGASPHERRALARRLAHILDQPVDTILEKMDRSGQYVRLATRVHPKIAVEVQEIGNRAVFVEADQRRYYTEGSLASHVLGYVDGAGQGQSGVEAALDAELRGTSVLMQRRRDRRGLDVDRLRDIDRISSAGMDVHLTLDRRVQHITERALQGVLERSEPASATAVVLDPRTGDVLALATVPSYNPNALPEDQATMRNRAILDAVEPGSVLKPFVAAAAIEERKVSLDTIVDCENGRWSVGRSRIGDDHPHGAITVSEVIKFSSNIGSAKLAFKLGASTYLDYLNRFGFGVPTGIELPHERGGVVRKAETIKPIELATTSYGHGMTATALQLVSAMGTLANGGVRMRPRLVSRIVDEDGVPHRVVEPQVLDRVVSEQTAREITRAMVSVTERGGTATRARVPGFEVAGKTGTAWKVENGRYSDGRIGSFVGFVPADDPRLAIVVVVDDIRKGSRYGGIAAAPAFAEIAEHSLRYLGVQPDPELLAAAQPKAPAAPRRPVASKPPPPAPRALTLADDDAWRLPDLQGRSLREALVELQGTGLKVELAGSGRLAAMDPVPGSQVSPGETVRLTFR